MTYTELNISTGIRNVSKQVFPDLRVSSQFVMEVENTLNILLKRLVKNALLFKKQAKRTGMLANDFQSAVKVSLNEELVSFAVSEGVKAVTKSTAQTTRPNKKKGERQSRSVSAGLIFSVSKVENSIRSLLSKQDKTVSSLVFPFATAVLEYVTAEMCEAAGKQTRKMKKSTISLDSIKEALKDDQPLEQILSCN
jgi:histone H2A